MSKIIFYIKMYDNLKKGNGYVLTILENGIKEEVKKHFQVNQKKSEKSISLAAVSDVISRSKEGDTILIKTNNELVGKYVKKAINNGWKLPVKLCADLRVIAKLMDDVKTREIEVIPWRERIVKTVELQPVFSSENQ